LQAFSFLAQRPVTAMYLLPPTHSVLLVVAMMPWLFLRHGASLPNFPHWCCYLPAASPL
jgi:hypothetical protein